MRAILCNDWGEPDTLVLGEAPSPVAGPGEVTLRVRAAGVNFADIVLVRGQYQEKPDLPFSPGLECAGEILTVGEGVSNVAVGDRVMVVPGVGAFAEEVSTKASDVFAIPEGMDFDTAAAFPVAYGTSHLALTDRGALKAGETLLVLGAGGGVGLTAVECGKALGATVIAAASTSEKLDLAQAHGADHVINYVDEDLRAAVRKLTDGAGVDVVYDPVGGDLSKAALRSMAWSGRLLVIGFAAGEVPQIAANYLLVKNISVVGVYWGAYKTKEPETYRASFDELAKWYSEGRLKPHVSQVFPLAQAAEALGVLESRQATGRLVVDIDA
ncbi:MAG: zinc-binding dehydrogenase [Alphaproteobacteria bacterium]|nr:zinc-binding dehydrogenase [Alphaproteobacteria bacterium]